MERVLMHSFEAVLFVSIVLVAVDIVLLYAVLYVIGKEYSFFAPWRALLVGCMLYCGYLFASDMWWFLAEIPLTSQFSAARMLLGRLLFSAVIWVFSYVWWRSIRTSQRSTTSRG